MKKFLLLIIFCVIFLEASTCIVGYFKNEYYIKGQDYKQCAYDVKGKTYMKTVEYHEMCPGTIQICK